MAITPAPTNIYKLNQRPRSSKTNVSNFYHFVVGLNICNSDISCHLYHSYIHQQQNFRYLLKMPTYLSQYFLQFIVTWKYFTLWEYSIIICWLLPLYILNSIEGWQIYVMILKMSALFLWCSCQLKCCWNKDKIKYEADVLPCTENITAEVKTQ